MTVMFQHALTMEKTCVLMSRCEGWSAASAFDILLAVFYSESGTFVVVLVVY